MPSEGDQSVAVETLTSSRKSVSLRIRIPWPVSINPSAFLCFVLFLWPASV